MGLQMESDHLRWTCCQILEECIFHFLYSKLHSGYVFVSKGPVESLLIAYSMETCAFKNCCKAFTAIPKSNHTVTQSGIKRILFYCTKMCEIKTVSLAVILPCYLMLIC